MIRPQALTSSEPYGPSSSRACDIWDAMVAADAGDVGRLRGLIASDPAIVSAEYWYTKPLHLAVRGGHRDAVVVLLGAGADPAARGVTGDDMAEMARERGYDDVVALLEEARALRGRTEPDAGLTDHPIHAAAADGDLDRVRELLDAEPGLTGRGDSAGGTPLHRAVAAGHEDVVRLLLERGADIHALHGAGPGTDRGYAAPDFQPIDFALWHGTFWNPRGDTSMARVLVQLGAKVDIVIASALGDTAAVEAMLDADPDAVRATRPSGKHALSTAVEFGHDDIARLLLDRGADPAWPDGDNAPQGTSLHAASRRGALEMVELLLAHGASPDSGIDSSGNAAYVAKTGEIRKRLLDAGGTLEVYDLIWLDEDEEALRRVRDDPSAADAGCGGAFAAACRMGKRELVEALIAAGARVPPVVTGCRTYLLEKAELLRLLLESGMDPNLPDWQHVTPLHDTCGRNSRGQPLPERVECATSLLDAGADVAARDDEHRSTPLAWAARNGLLDMVELLLARGAPAREQDDEPWAAPLAWAERRGHEEIAQVLRAADPG